MHEEVFFPQAWLPNYFKEEVSGLDFINRGSRTQRYVIELLAWLISLIIIAATPVPMFITLTYIIFAVLSSGGIGVVSGLYPAYKASKLDPIVALMRE